MTVRTSNEPARRVATRLGVFKLAVVALGLLVSPLALDGQVIPPNEAWRTLRTEHFRVTFPAHLETLGRRAADRAERAWAELEDAFVEPPPSTVDLLVTDHVDQSNGFAQVRPSNRVTIFARPPADELSLGHFDDWLELVITHELAHIVHLDRTGTWFGKLGRAVFGRPFSAWPLFPQVDTPNWVIEGLATWYESKLTDAGRVHGTYHDMVTRTAALEGRFEDIGQASGSSPQWPGGTRWYAYGSLFFEYLLDKYGEDRMAALVEAIGGQWVPYRLDAAGRSALGVSLTDEWALWAEAELAAAEELLEALGPAAPVERLTQKARWALHPAVSPDGSRLAYARSDGTRDIHLRVADPDGLNGGQLTRTNGLSTFDWTPSGTLIFSQREYVDRFRVFSDLYEASQSGDVRRITEGARLTQPSVEPSGRSAVAVAQGAGSNSLVRVDLASGAVTELVGADPDVHWAFPAVSPDGRWIAVSRWSPDAYHDVVVLDAGGRLAYQVTNDRAMDLAPTWSPDGAWLLWGSDRSGIPNVIGVPIGADGPAGSARSFTRVPTGAAYPSVDPSGEWLYFSGYHVDGWEVERVAFDPAGAGDATEVLPRFRTVTATTDRGALSGEVQSYSSLPTLLPTYWEVNLREPVESRPVRRDDLFLRSRELLGFGIGAETGGTDLVGRHSWAALARTFTSGGKSEGQLSYRFYGLGNPEVGLFASQGWDDDGSLVARTDAQAPLDTLFVLERSRNLSTSLTFRRPTLRRSLSATVSAGLVWEQRELFDNALLPETRYRLNRPSSRLADFGVSFSASTARSRSFQMGGSAGASAFIRLRRRSELNLADSLSSVAGSDRSFDDVLTRVQAYLPIDGPGYGAHVLAFRGAFGAARGPNADAGHFDVGGASGSRETVTGFDLFGGDFVFFPVRGYDRSARFGRYAWTASLEYRVPLIMLNRGVRAWPVHFDRVVGSVFADAGNAWGPDQSASGFQNPRGSTLSSVGAELTLQVLTFWEVSMRFRGGVAVPLLAGVDPRVYVRLGMPF